jgi:hypothetical protein
MQYPYYLIPKIKDFVLLNPIRKQYGSSLNKESTGMLCFYILINEKVLICKLRRKTFM